MKLELLNSLDANAIVKELKLSSSKEGIAKQIQKLKIPNKKSEKYRYFDIESIVNQEYNLVTTNAQEVQKGVRKLVIKDGSLIKVPNIDGLKVELADSCNTAVNHFDALYYASHLMATKVIKITISKDINCEIEHIISKEDSLINYRIAIFANANTHSTIYESFKVDSNSSAVVAGSDIFVAKDASLNLIKNKTLNANSTKLIYSDFYKVDTNATFNLGGFDFVNSDVLNIFKTELAEFANFNATHLLYTNGDTTKAGTVSEIEHIGKSSKSVQNAKNILNNNSRGIFDALIRVQNSAAGTVAHQNSKAVLLQSGAYMASKPQLEIYIDDLEASHGSTTGQLDEKALFYLTSRGIKEVDAKKMLILAFANEAIDVVANEQIRGYLYTDFEKAYYGSAELDCMKSCHSCEDMILKD
jgi:Fe-S cluster assembly protein SufD